MPEKIKITMLGTGSSIPTARRNHPSVLLHYKDENILFDCGEGTQRQLRKAKLNPCKVTKILISHWHGDHVFGIPGLIQTLMMNGYNRKLEIYGPKGTKQKMRAYADLFIPRGDRINLEVHEVSDEKFFENDEFYLETALMEHGADTNAYSFVVKEKSRIDKEKLKKLKLANSPLVGELSRGKTVEVNGKKIDGKKLIYSEPGKKITVVMDTRKCENAIKISKGADVLICESTFSAEEQEVAKEYLHLTSVDAASIAKSAKVKRLILTHLSQRYGAVPKVILSEAKKIFSNVSVAEDLEWIEV
ncbi:MAG: ribonuclease Z [archaeon]